MATSEAPVFKPAFSPAFAKGKGKGVLPSVEPEGRQRRHLSFEIRHSTFVPAASNLKNVLKKTIIRVVAEVGGLKFGKGVVVEF